MPPGKEDRVDGAENFMARILDENMFSARNPADEFLLRVSPDAEIMVRRAEKNGAPDGFGRAGRKDFTGDSGGFGDPAAGRNTVLPGFTGILLLGVPAEAGEIRRAGGGEILLSTVRFHEKRILSALAEKTEDTGHRACSRCRDAAGVRRDHRRA